MNEIAVLKINNYDDRDSLITALANAGYCVWVEVKGEDYTWQKDFLVHVCEVKKEASDVF